MDRDRPQRRAVKDFRGTVYRGMSQLFSGVLNESLS
jgi:hypothetical protein